MPPPQPNLFLQPSIQTLPEPTQSQLRSTQILTSLPQLVSELVQNALDASAYHVDVGIDCEEWECWVRDDGVGMSKDGLGKLGSGARMGRYNTSKAYTPASLNEVTTFGFRGEALASAADVSCLEISSRTARSRESWSIILKEGKTIYTGPSLRWRRDTHGTVVSIRDAFYNLPVRKRSHPSTQKTVEMVRREIETYALMFPEVAFTLEETKKPRSGSANRTTQRVLSVPKTSSAVATFRHLYGRALAEHVDEIDEVHTESGLRINGFISLDGAQSKSHQFLYLNRHPLAPCDLFRVIDTRFASSSFSKHAFDEQGEMSQPRSNVRRSPRKSEKKPVYVLNISVPPQDVDNCLEPAKASVHLRDGEAVSAFMSSVVQDFLVRHGFATARSAPKRPRNFKPDDGSPRKKKSKITSYSTQETNAASSKTPSYNTRSHKNPADTPMIGDDTNPDGLIVWKDPHTGLRYAIDNRTGNSYPLNNDIPAYDKADEDEVAQTSVSRRTIQAASSSCDLDTPGWIKRALQANGAYTSTERKIPSCTDVTTLVRWDDPESTHTSIGRIGKEDLTRARVVGQVDRKFIACVLESSGITEENMKEDEATLILIDQHAADERVRVERFLKELCHAFLQPDIIFNASSSTGDHSERDCGIAECLDPPIPVLLTRREAARIMKSEETRNVFWRWGVSFVEEMFEHDETDDEEEPDVLKIWQVQKKRKRRKSESEGAYAQVKVQRVPALLRDKLLMNDELRDMVKSMLAHLETVGFPPSMPSTPTPTPAASQSQSPPAWQRALRWCPPHLLDLINSKACRGAIMFNDVLTVEQCERLVDQLSRTDVPFQCAHGRPSLVPLVSHRGRVDDDGVRKRQVDWEKFGQEEARR